MIAWGAGALVSSGLTGDMLAARVGVAPRPPMVGVVASPSPATSPAPGIAAQAPVAPPVTQNPTTVPAVIPISGAAPSSPTPAPTAAIAAPRSDGDRPIASAQISARAPRYNGAFLRAEPTLRSQRQRYLPNGTRVAVLEGVNQADSYRWSRVRTEDGSVGWIVSDTIGR
jgi:hypothetical protein